MIKEVKKYTDDEERSVTALIPKTDSDETMDWHAIEKTIEYKGQVGIKTPMGIMPVHFDFPEEYTLQDCFDNFDEVGNKEVNRIIKEAEEKAKEDNLIITPGQNGGQQIPFSAK